MKHIIGSIASLQQGISRAAFHDTLYKSLKLHAYTLQLAQKIICKYISRKQSSLEILSTLKRTRRSLTDCFCLMKQHFMCVGRVVNWNKCHIWWSKNPYDVTEHECELLKVSVWCSLMKKCFFLIDSDWWHFSGSDGECCFVWYPCGNSAAVRSLYFFHHGLCLSRHRVSWSLDFLFWWFVKGIVYHENVQNVNDCVTEFSELQSALQMTCAKAQQGTRSFWCVLCHYWCPYCDILST